LISLVHAFFIEESSAVFTPDPEFSKLSDFQKSPTETAVYLNAVNIFTKPRPH